MRFRIPAIPLIEVVVVTGLALLGLACLLVRDSYTRYVNGPASYGAPDMRIGSKMYDEHGRHIYDWIPAEDDKPSRWVINEQYVSEIDQPRKPSPAKP